MQFVYYSEKTVSQCMLALNERLHQKSGKLDGWVEKSGNFSLSVSTKVLRRFSRSTRLHGQVTKENGVTVVRGYVSNGADPQNRYIIYGILLVLGGAAGPCRLLSHRFGDHRVDFTAEHSVGGGLYQQ